MTKETIIEFKKWLLERLWKLKRVKDVPLRQKSELAKIESVREGILILREIAERDFIHNCSKPVSSEIHYQYGAPVYGLNWALSYLDTCEAGLEKLSKPEQETNNPDFDLDF